MGISGKNGSGPGVIHEETKMMSAHTMMCGHHHFLTNSTSFCVPHIVPRADLRAAIAVLARTGHELALARGSVRLTELSGRRERLAARRSLDRGGSKLGLVSDKPLGRR